jgi:hypothetical protein
MRGIKVLLGSSPSGGGGGGGSTSGAVDLRAASVSGLQYAQWTIDPTGFTFVRNNAGAAVQDESWIDPQVGMDQYEVIVDLLSGSVPPGDDLSSWMNITLARTWGWTAEDNPQNCQLRVRIRQASTGAIIDEATVSLTVNGIV